MLKVQHSNSRAWRANTIDPPDCWRFRLPHDCLRRLDQAVADLRNRPRPVTEWALADFDGLADDRWLEPVLATLEGGRGFAIIDGLPEGCYSPGELTTIYWLV